MTQAVALTFPAPTRFADVGAGRPGKAFVDDEDAVPHDALREVEDRDDCAVDDFNLRTRDEDLGGGVAEADGVEAVT